MKLSIAVYRQFAAFLIPLVHIHLCTFKVTYIIVRFQVLRTLAVRQYLRHLSPFLLKRSAPTPAFEPRPPRVFMFTKKIYYPLCNHGRKCVFLFYVQYISCWALLHTEDPPRQSVDNRDLKTFVALLNLFFITLSFVHSPFLPLCQAIEQPLSAAATAVAATTIGH